jgi:putative nucleotidyltransferase with HDIG domain
MLLARRPRTSPRVVKRPLGPEPVLISPPPEPEHPEGRPALDLRQDLDRSLHRGRLAEGLLLEVRQLAVLAPTADRPFYAGLIRALTNDGLQLPAMPEMVIKIQRLLDEPNLQIEQLIKLLAREPAVATKVVGIANSALCRGSHTVRGLRDAVVRIGLRETKNVVLAILCRSKLFRVAGYSAESKRLYRHALATSLATQLIGRPLGLDPDLAFLAGLVHDLGSVAMLSIAADVTRHTRGQAKISAATLADADRLLHARIGALIAQAWGFGEELVAAVEHHHQPEHAPEGVARRLAEAIAQADVVADRVTSNERDAQHPVEQEARNSFEAFEIAIGR